MARMPREWTQPDKIKGTCDYCHKKRLIGKKTEFCDECYYEWNRVCDKYMDGDPLQPFKTAMIMAKLMMLGNPGTHPNE